MIVIIGYILAGIVGVIVLLGLIYLASGIQMRGWLDTFDKYLIDKFNNSKKDGNEREN